MNPQFQLLCVQFSAVDSSLCIAPARSQGVMNMSRLPSSRKTSHREPEEKRQKRLGDPGQASSSEEPVAHVTEVETMALGTLAAAAAAAPAAAPAPAQPPIASEDEM